MISNNESSEIVSQLTIQFRLFVLQSDIPKELQIFAGQTDHLPTSQHASSQEYRLKNPI